MKKSILILILFHIGFLSKGQSPSTLRLQYTVVNKIYQADAKQNSVLIAQQELIAKFYKKGNCYFFYATPIDTGTTINSNMGNDVYANASFKKDSLQMVQYRNTDSAFNLIYLQRGEKKLLNRFPIVKGFQKWSVLPQTKKIGSFNCQKAVWKDDGDIVAEIWFAPDIPVFYGLQNFDEVPGLIIEATLMYPHIEFKLVKYEANIPLKEEELLPIYMRGTPNLLSKEDYLNAQERLRKLRRTQGRLN
jgi:GLPGLI family protein